MTIGRSQAPYRMFAKLFLTWDKRAKLLRCGRIVWAKGKPGFGGYSAKLSLALTPKLFQFRREWRSYLIVLFGVRLHFERSCGGWHA